MEILFLVHRVPHPPNKGDRIRSYHLLKFLATQGQVHLACLADETVSDETERELRGLCRQVSIVPLPRTKRWLRAAQSVIGGDTATEGLFDSPNLRSTIREWARRISIDRVVVFCSSMGPYIDLAELRHIPSIVDLVDFDSQKWFDYASQAFPPRRWALQLEGHRLRTLEVALARRSRAVVLVSQPEADLFRNVTGCQNVHAVTNGVDLGSFCPLESSDPDLRRRCTFVGALDYRANVDGVLWFCQHVWPQVHARMPDRFFSIVGRRPTRAVRRLANLPGVELVGEVADVQPYYARTAFTVAPLHVARGIQNKILESLAMGKTVVGSPEALEGLDVTAGKQVLAAALPAQWVDQICHLFENPDIASRLGAAGREFVEQRHCWETCLRPFADLLRTDDRDTEQWPAPTNGCASLPSGTGHARGKSVSKVAE